MIELRRRWTALRRRNRERVAALQVVDATITEAIAVVRDGRGSAALPPGEDRRDVAERLDRARFAWRTGACAEACAHESCARAHAGLELARAVLAVRDV